MHDQTKSAREVWSGADPRAYTVRELSRRTRNLSGSGLPLVSESSLRAYTRRRKNPLPSFKVGEKRPHVYVFEPVLRAFLLFEQGCCEYAEVDEAARQCLMGARS